MITERRAALGVGFTEFKNHKKDVQKKILLSAGLGAVMVGIAWGGLPYLALKEGTEIARSLSGLANNGLVLGLSYGIQTVSSFLNINQERRLLENPEIGMSQSFGATVAFYGLEKIKPLKKKEHRSIAAVVIPSLVALGWSIPREITFVSLALLSPDKMQEIAVLKSTHGLFSLSQAGAAEIVLRTIGRDKNSEDVSEELKESRFASARRAVRAAASTVLFSSTHVPK